MEAILKFFTNTQKVDKNLHNEVISRTLLKVAVISRFAQEKFADQPDRLPKHGELWRCRIAKESGAGRSKGCFICEPLVRVEEAELVKLVPGTYTMKLIGKQIIIRPKEEFRGKNWIISIQHKRILAEEHGAYCVIVDLDATPLETTVPQTHTGQS